MESSNEAEQSKLYKAALIKSWDENSISQDSNGTKIPSLQFSHQKTLPKKANRKARIQQSL